VRKITGIGLLLAIAFGAFGASPVRTPSKIDSARLATLVREEFVHAWKGYERYAWGHDELKPLTRAPKDWHGEESLLMTPVDAFDTMLLMGLNEEAEKAKALIFERLSFDKDISVKNFEITIRLLGGLLSSYQMTQDPRFLALAEDLGTRLLPVFDSPTGMPYMFVNLKTGQVSGAKSNPAEIGTLILEFGTLARLTNKPVFFEKAKRALAQLTRRRAKTGLVGEEIDVETGDWTSRTSHIGGGIDSYYEYLVKCGKLFDDKDCARSIVISRTIVLTGSGTERRTWSPAAGPPRPMERSMRSFRPCWRCRAIWVAPAGCRTRASGCGHQTGSSPRFTTTAYGKSSAPAISCGPRSSSRRTPSSTTRRTLAISRWASDSSTISSDTAAPTTASPT